MDNTYAVLLFPLEESLINSFTSDNTYNTANVENNSTITDFTAVL